ncbi:alpha-amylase family glycosyl hydrolase [Halobacteriaceae archaeon SHR40]|uniref:alpha-amylase family glycosyl hydrolase n=1 Tax=Halovenus amylolytica TaxID=2500550 RepID=UPI000FE3EB9C
MQAPEHERAGRADTHHPGHPRFVEVGEAILNPAHVGEYGVFGVRDNLAPRIPDPEADPENYEADAFQWSLIDRPADSEAELQYAQSIPDGRPRWDSGARNTADFVADTPGRYVFELDAPDGTHEWTFHAFPNGEGPPPRLTLDGHYEEATETFHIEADARLAPDRNESNATVETVYLADDRDALSTVAIDTDGLDAEIPVAALDGESARVHAAAWDGQRRSMMDTVELHPDGSISLPNRPPEWAKDGVLYQLFPRSWAGERGETTMDDLIAGVDYLDDLGIDMVWLTPVVPDEATARQFDQSLVPDSYREAGTLSGGGPHGYGTLGYFGIAPDLVPEGDDPVEAYQAFVEACHDREIKVVFDLVISHSGRSHPFFQDTIASEGRDTPTPFLRYPGVTAWNRDSKYFDWYDRIDLVRAKKGLAIEARPYATGFFGGRSLPNFNYNNVAVREHMLAVADFWSGVVGVDGFRCDIAWGVPISFWSELRDLVRANDSEFLMLDETIPNDPRMAENAFDMHFDTKGFTDHSQRVATGEASPDALVDVIKARANDGIPPHSLVLNMTENHDEHRLLNQAVVDLSEPNHDEVTDEQWDRGARRQRLCWAAGLLLPGVPGIYYGQERQISRFGEGRHLGRGDPRGNGDTVDSGADVRPGGRQRAFMNWEAYSESHLALYRNLITLYHDLDVLKPDAKLHEVRTTGTDGLLVFGRDAGHLDGVKGPEQVVVFLNFRNHPVEVAVPPSVGDTDLVTGNSVRTQAENEWGTLVEVEGVLVLETSGLFS